MPPKDIAELIGMTEAEQQQTAREHRDLRQGRPPSVPSERPQQDDIGLSDRYAGQPERAEEPPADQQQGQAPQVPQVPQPLHEQTDQPGVPRQALQRERAARQERDREIEQMRAELAQTRERFAMLNETVRGALQPAQQPTQDQLPNPEEDLLGYVRAIEERANRRADERIKPIEEWHQRQVQTEEVTETIKAVKSVAEQHRQEFQSEAPDFNDAYKWMRDVKYRGLVAQGGDPVEVNQYLDNEEYQLVAKNARMGRNSAEAFYNAARAMGWQPQAPQQQNGNGNAHIHQQQPTMRQPAPAHLPPGQPSMATVRTGMMEGSSIGQAAQSGGGVPMDLAQLVDLPDAEFYRQLGRVKAAMARLR